MTEQYQCDTCPFLDKGHHPDFIKASLLRSSERFKKLNGVAFPGWRYGFCHKSDRLKQRCAGMTFSSALNQVVLPREVNSSLGQQFHARLEAQLAIKSSTQIRQPGENVVAGNL